MNDLKNMPSNNIETLYGDLRKEALENIAKFPVAQIKVKANTSKIAQNQFSLLIPENKNRENIIFKLENSGIDFTQNANEINTTIAGVSLACQLLTSEKQKELQKLENEIQSRINKDIGIDIFVKLDNNKDFGWAASGERLGNTYYFKTLPQAEEALQKGYIKSPYEPLNITQWHVPTTKPNHWELPSTMKYIIEPEDISPAIIIDGGDEIAMALNGSGIPELLAYGLQATVLYPLFLSVIAVGYEGADEEEKAHRELLERNLETKKELREMLIQSLVRETKIKEELKTCMEKGEVCKKDSQTYKLISALSKEGVVRESLAKMDSVFSQDKLLILKDETKKIDKDIEGIISMKTLQNLSDKRFFKAMIEKGNKISNNQESYVKFVQDLSQWKQASDKTFLRKLQRYLQTQVLKVGMGWMWCALAAFEANAIINTLGSAGIKTPAHNAIDSVLSSTGGYLAVSGQSAMVIYGIAKTYGGAKTAMSLNDWIKKINQSELIDKDSKQLITNYLKSRKVHEIIGECVGNALLSAGQMMMVLGGPAGGLGTMLILPGAGVTILGVGITLTNNIISENKFQINDKPNKIEAEILSDYTSVNDKDRITSESHFHANLKWKANELLNVSSKREDSLLWMNIYSQIIKKCENRTKPSSQEEFEKVSKEIIKKVKSLYPYRFSANMKSLTKEVLSKDETQKAIINDIQKFYDNRSEFYNNILHNVIFDKSEQKLEKFMEKNKVEENVTSKGDVEVKLRPVTEQFHDELTLISELKKNKLWDETERKLVKSLVINKKSEGNLNGSHFEAYIKTIPLKQNRYVSIPSPIPLMNIKFKNPFVPNKSKTIYVFREEEFINDMKNYPNIAPKRKKLFDEVLDTLMTEHKNAVGRVITTEGNYKVKSDVYRPLWKEIPQLVYQEQLEKQMRHTKDEEVIKPLKKELIPNCI